MKTKWISITAIFAICILSNIVHAQLTAPRDLSGTPQRISKLEEQLINGLKATRVDQQTFIKNVSTQVNQRRLDRRLVNAIYVWARKRQPLYPFPYFERGLRIEAKKRNVILPQVKLIIDR